MIGVHASLQGVLETCWQNPTCAFRRIRSAVPTTSGQSFRGIRSAEDRCRVGMALMSGAVAFVNVFGGGARAAQ